MKRFTITITGACADDVPDEWIHDAAASAAVQIEEPEIQNPDDVWNPLKFSTTDVDTHVTVTPD